MFESTAPRTRYFALSLFVCLGACGKLPPSDAQDLTRLALLDLSSAVELVNDDHDCGFESPGAISMQQIMGQAGTDGTVVRKIEGCTIDLDKGPGRYPYFACDAHAGMAKGRIKFSGTRTINGRITGDDKSPVIPSASDALTITIEHAELSGFEIARSDKAGSLSIQSGSVSGTVRIGLAAAANTGLCQAATPNAQLSDIVFQNADVRFTNLLRVRNYRIDSSALQATNGKYAGHENELHGSIILDGMRIDVPNGNLFDPEYTAQGFEATFACPKGQVRQPVTTQCADVDEFYAANTARSSFLALIDLVSLISDDSQCGFQSSAVIAAATTSGARGSLGMVTYTVKDCTIAFSQPHDLAKDCLGHSDAVTGQATISAVKTMTGILSNDPNKPVLPVADSPITVQITASTLQNFSMTHNDRAIVLQSGSLTGSMTPRVALGTTRGFCSVPTKIAELSNVSLSQSTMRLTTDSGVITTVTDDSHLSGMNGPWKGEENAIAGAISMKGRTFTIPMVGDPQSGMLETSYDAAALQQTWSCDPGLAQPVSFDCSTPDLPVPETIARQTVGMFGALTTFIENDATCGFQSPGVMAGAQFSGHTGDEGTTTFTVQSCRLEFPMPTQITQDCNGKTATIQGVLTFNVTKSMNGYNTGRSDRLVIPTARDAITFNTTVDLENVTYTEQPPAGAPIGLTFTKAQIAGTASPRLAIDKTTSVCGKATPVTTFQNVRYGGGDTVVGIVFPGLLFSAPVSGVNLSAQAGRKDATENTIGGTLTVSGMAYTFPIHGSSALDPAYSAAMFDAGYLSCQPMIAVPQSDTECDFKEVLALQTARAMPMVVESLSGLVNADQNCGLNIAAGRLDAASTTGGGRGSPGSATWFAPHNATGACPYAGQNVLVGPLADANGHPQPDCAGRELRFDTTSRATNGDVLVRAGLTVRGILASNHNRMYANPTSPDAPTDYLMQSNVANLLLYEREGGAVTRSLYVGGGSFDIAFNPIMGRSTDSHFTYLIHTPINRLNHVNFTSGSPTPISIYFQGMKFNLALASASVSGFSGAYHNDTMGPANHIQGTVAFAPTAARSDPIMVNDMLDPAYSQTDFDQRYGCTQNLAALIAP